MKRIICFNIFLLLSFCSIAQVDTSFHIYLLAGQSNMAGRGDIDSISKIVHPQVLMLDKNNNWVPATDPVHFDKPVAGVGPAISFATEMLGSNPKIRIGLVPCAWGGSSIKVWEPDSAYLTGHPYDDAVRRTKIAMQQGVLKGILWHQGESDNTPQGVDYYMEKIKTLVARFRSEFNTPDIPFVAGEIGYFVKSPRINPVLNQIPQYITNAATVSAEGLTANADQIHFNTASARELGKRYAIAIKQLQFTLMRK